jgi:uncharacterized membrane protein
MATAINDVTLVENLTSMTISPWPFMYWS